MLRTHAPSSSATLFLITAAFNTDHAYSDRTLRLPNVLRYASDFPIAEWLFAPSPRTSWRWPGVCARFGCDRPCGELIALPGSILRVAGPGRARRTPSSGGDRPAAANATERNLESLDWAGDTTSNRSQIANGGYLHVLHMAEIAVEQRRSRKLNEARLTANRIHTFAGELVICCNWETGISAENQTRFFSSCMLSPSPRISLVKTSKLAGVPASSVFSPLTMLS